MITLYVFGSAFGLPDPSPFVMKTELLLKMAGVPYQTQRADVRKAPKKKLPYINDEGVIVADSTFIRLHLEKKYGYNFDLALTARDQGISLSVEKMLEEFLYFMLVESRWLQDANFANGPKVFFKRVPALIRPFVIKTIRQKIRDTVWAQGLGRHSQDEISVMAHRTLGAVAAIIGDNPYLMGNTPCGADATAFAFIVCSLSKQFTSPLRTAAESYPNLITYCDQMMQQYFPTFALPSTWKSLELVE